MACNCKLPSGFTVSGNLSRTGQQGTGCADGAKLPSAQRLLVYNGNYTALGAGTTIPKTRLFSADFSRSGSSGICAYLAAHTYDTILGKGDTDIRALFASCFIIASKYGTGTTFPSTTTLQNMWTAVKGGGNYTPPSSTVAWTQEGVRKYLMYLTGQKTS